MKKEIEKMETLKNRIDYLKKKVDPPPTDTVKKVDPQPDIDLIDFMDPNVTTVD